MASTTGGIVQAGNSEFALHVHKLSATAERENLYTIGTWQGTALVAICHVQPIDRALSAIRCLLEQQDSPQSGLFVLSARKQAVRATGTLHRLRVGAAALLATLLKPLR